MKTILLILLSFVALIAKAQIIYYDDFESAPHLPGVGHQTCCAYSLTYVNFADSNSARFELRQGDPLTSSGTRTEIKMYDIDPMTSEMGSSIERWYSWDWYFPSATWLPDSYPELTCQFHQGNGESPSISIEEISGTMRLRVRPTTSLKYSYPLGNIQYDGWHHWVMHIIHSYTSAGLIEIWKDGTKILTRSGANSYDWSTAGGLGFDKPKWKTGIYKWDWNSGGLTDQTLRVYYLDNIRLGNATATYNDMTPAANPVVYPIANAGNDATITLPTTTSSLSGSGSDPAGGSVTYAWTQVSGPVSSSITSASSASTNVTGLSSAGLYTYRLTVTKSGGLTASDIATITVNPQPNTPPTANAGADQSITLPTSSVTLNGSGSSDPDGSITAYAWTLVSGPNTPTIVSPSAASTSVTGMIQGTYSFRLTVTDNLGATASDLTQVIVNPAVPPANLPPTANAGSDISIQLPTNSTTLNGSGSDPDGTISFYAWTKLSGPAGGSITSPASASTTITGMNTAGTYTYMLTVTDNLGATGTDVVQIVVNPAANIPPVVSAGTDISILYPINYTSLSGTATDSDGTISSILWVKTAGSDTYTITNSNTLTPSLSNLVPGVYTFQLIVTDNNGETSTDSVNVTVAQVITTPNKDKFHGPKKVLNKINGVIQ